MSFKKILILLLFTSSNLLNAQTNYKPGFIITNIGDTIFGEIDYRGDLLMSNICKFRTNENTIINYTPENIISYRFIEGKYFISKKINKQSVFLEYLIKGEVNIYYLRDKNGDHYYIDKKNEKLTELPYKKGVKYIDNKRVFYETTKHIGLLRYFMQDAPNLLSQINNIKEPNHNNLIKLAENYQNTICKDEKCIIYDKNIKSVKIIPEIIGGVVNFNNVENLNDRFYLQSGFIIHKWMPRTNENLYFKTGLLFSKLEFTDGNYNYFKVPIQIEYIYPKSIIRPRISYGLNMYYPFYHSVSFNIGTNIKISKSIFIGITSDIEFNALIPFIILPSDMLSYSLNASVYVKI